MLVSDSASTPSVPYMAKLGPASQVAPITARSPRSGRRLARPSEATPKMEVCCILPRHKMMTGGMSLPVMTRKTPTQNMKSPEHKPQINGKF